MPRNTPKPNNRRSRVAALQKLIDGLTLYQATFTTVMIEGEQLATSQVLTKLGEIVTAALAVETALAAWEAAVSTDVALSASTASFVSHLRQALLIAFSGQLEALAAFGLTERKRRVFTPEQVQVAAAKARATRAARHTMGPRQKAQIKGVLPGAPGE